MNKRTVSESAAASFPSSRNQLMTAEILPEKSVRVPIKVMIVPSFLMECLLISHAEKIAIMAFMKL